MLKLALIPVTAFIVCALIGPVLIPYLHKLKFGQSIRECGPASHMKKSGTPTMGGLNDALTTLHKMIEKERKHGQ